MSFDTLAPHYRWMEWLFAGDRLQSCRTAFLKDIPTPSNALLFGEGNGRFLEAFCRQFPGAKATVVDSSAGMLVQAKQRLEAQGLNYSAISFICADVLKWQPASGAYDLIVTCFFLDCFSEEELQELMPKIARSASPSAHWLQADFQIIGSAASRLRSWLTLRFLYAFFRRVTHIQAVALTSPAPFIRQAGFFRRRRHVTDWRRLYSEWWCRSAELSPMAACKPPL